MRRVLLVSVLALVSSAVPARAQNMKLADVAGAWNVKSMVGPNDSVLVTSVITATANEKGWTVKYPNRDPIPVRVVAHGGDSVVTEMGPYASIVRPGQTVKLVRTVTHFSGNTSHGTFEATYASGDVVKGKTAGQRTK